ncbi:hypothetical protein Tco_0433192 [Tanacetum coccineum]
MKKADEQHVIQSNAPADDCESNDVFENLLAKREYTPPIVLVFLSCDPPAADVEDARTSRNVQRHLFSGAFELQRLPDNAIQNRVVEDKYCVHVSTVFERLRNTLADHTGVRNRPLSTTAPSYTVVDERDAPAGRRVTTSLTMSQPAIPVNGGGLLVSFGQPFSNTGITRRQDISNGTTVPISTIFNWLRNLGDTLLYSPFSLDNDDGLMIRKYFTAYTKTDVPLFHATLIQHMESLKESIQERAMHKQEYDRRVNDRTMQSKEGKVASSKALDAGLIVTECSRTESEKHDTSSRSGNDTHAEDAYIKPMNDKEPMAKDADIKPVNDKEPMAEVQLTAQHNVLANEQQHSMQSEPIYDTHLLEKVDSNTTLDSTNMCHRGGEIDQNAKKCQVSCPLLDPSFDNMTTKFSNQSLESENISLKKTVAQFQKDLSRMEAHCVNLELKYQNLVLKLGQHGQISMKQVDTDGYIFNTVGLRWVPTGKTFTSSTTMVDCEPPNGSYEDITNPYESNQTLNVSTGTLNLSAGTSFNPKKERLRVCLLKRVIYQKPRVPGIYI